MSNLPDISIVVPVLNEEENVRPLVARVREALESQASWELLLVNDGSTDATANLVRAEAAVDERVRLVSLAARYGQSAAMQAGFDHSRGKVVITMDGDLQNDPRDIPLLLDKLAEGNDLVAGYRMQRQDRWLSRKVPSWIANRMIRGITGVAIRDNGCSLKAYRRELLDRMRLYSDMHRFIPALAAGTAAARIAEVEVRHHARTAGTSSYGLSRVWKVLIDLLTIKMIRSFRQRPLRLFLRVLAVPVAAAVTMTIVGIVSTTTNVWGVVYATVVLMLVALSFYLLMLGLLAECFVRIKSRGRQSLAPTARELAV